MKKKIIIIVCIITVIAAIGAATAYRYVYQPSKNFATSKADITLDAKALFDEFVKDQNSANTKYVSKDKTIQISGKISEVKKNEDNTCLLIIEVGAPDSDLSCTIVKEDSQKALSLKPGQIIKIKGQCTGYQDLINKEVQMIGCGIVE